MNPGDGPFRALSNHLATQQLVQAGASDLTCGVSSAK
jgi:hypothetical protein